jgi:HAE1 family hydrophobic/amphiphilic exporter-1
LTTLAIIGVGAVSLASLRTELVPSLQYPMAAVLGTYPGVPPSIVEQRLTRPMEAAIRSVPGVEEMNSTSTNSASAVIVEFAYGTDMTWANQRLTTALARLAPMLPDDSDTQVITGSMDELPVIQLAVSSESGTSADALANAVELMLVPRLEDIADIAAVTVSGFSPQQILITPDPVKMATSGVDPAAMAGVLAAYGLELPAGALTRGTETLSVHAGAPLTSAEQIADLSLPSQAGPVLLSDIATVEQGPAPATSLSRLNGEPSVAVSVTKTPAATVVDVSDAVHTVISETSDALREEGLVVEVAFDQAPFINDSIEALGTEGLLGLGFAVLVILAFLVSLSSTLVAAISIPLSLFIAFIVMRVTGESLNILTLGAMTIAIGRVVDDSIVVIENIKRHLSYGEDKIPAILAAVKEVGGAIASSTLCTVAVFAPIGLVGGIVGELFRPFALTVAVALTASLLVALTIVPVLAYWFVPAPVSIDQADLDAQREAALAKERRRLWSRAYLPTLRASLAHPVIVLLIALAVLGGTASQLPRMQTNFLDSMGGNTVTVDQQFAPATSLVVQADESLEVEQRLSDLPDVRTVQTTIGGSGTFGVDPGASTRATFAITLDPSADADAAIEEIRDAIEGAGGEATTGLTVADSASMMGGGSTVDLVVRSPNRDSLAEGAELVHQMALDVEGATDVTNTMAADTPAVRVDVDAAKAARLGLTEAAVVATVAEAMTPMTLGNIETDEGTVAVKLAREKVPAAVEELEELPLTLPIEATAKLGDVARVEVIQEPGVISRTDGELSATISLTPTENDLLTLTNRLREDIDALVLPAGVTVTVAGVAEMQADAFADLGLALAVAVAIVFIVMVATFGSLLQPLILLVSIPFAATGALAVMLGTGTPVGVAALIGVLMLVGIVVSNAIVLIDRINQLRRAGTPLNEAIIEGSRVRLRPIIMTAAATIFALVPMALGLTGHSTFISQPLALVVIGGLVSSTLLTLIVVPVLYMFVGRARDARDARREAALNRRRDARRAARAKALAAAASPTPEAGETRRSRRKSQPLAPAPVTVPKPFEAPGLAGLPKAPVPGPVPPVSTSAPLPYLLPTPAPGFGPVYTGEPSPLPQAPRVRPTLTGPAGPPAFGPVYVGQPSPLPQAPSASALAPLKVPALAPLVAPSPALAPPRTSGPIITAPRTPIPAQPRPQTPTPSAEPPAFGPVYTGQPSPLPLAPQADLSEWSLTTKFGPVYVGEPQPLPAPPKSRRRGGRHAANVEPDRVPGTPDPSDPPTKPTPTTPPTPGPGQPTTPPAE